ncbi:MAG: TRAP transporter small permease, partial [candidate division NC10 bacterium]|nr:TRAP transporter small permease [candidate division NC10 bacterium]
MERFSSKIRELSRFLNLIAGVALTFMMSLTVADVILRYFKRPVVGTYELVALSGAVVIGFSIPLTSWERGHIYVDFFLLKFRKKIRQVVQTATRLLGVGLFVLIGWNLIQMGMDLRRSGEVSLTLQLPFYPVAYGIGICC